MSKSLILWETCATGGQTRWEPVVYSSRRAMMDYLRTYPQSIEIRDEVWYHQLGPDLWLAIATDKDPNDPEFDG